MLENLIVALIVAVAAWYAASKYLPATLRAKLFGKKKASAGCGSGCSSCGTCEDGPAAPRIDASGPSSRRVIQLHLK
ncbi:FeoB-associated Cys-rich membrane protein [Massilia sp. CCM 8695]|uniref:FeoB-associated Cys-rich membrane protein n=1 Tax=Massilia frigida TaxID=2609281 RepID=A0ABX0NI72_9BURK|nr:FeoB-associated Cys-rich membrane protein [Massilia frigida]NHZ82403.1 FeoB-associated Cys-rich membrane protein [Massilia frigida]